MDCPYFDLRTSRVACKSFPEAPTASMFRLPIGRMRISPARAYFDEASLNACAKSPNLEKLMFTRNVFRTGLKLELDMPEERRLFQVFVNAEDGSYYVLDTKMPQSLGDRSSAVMYIGTLSPREQKDLEKHVWRASS